MEWQRLNASDKPMAQNDEITVTGPGECTVNPYVNTVVIKDSDTGYYFPLKYCTVYNGDNTKQKFLDFLVLCKKSTIGQNANISDNSDVPTNHPNFTK